MEIFNEAAVMVERKLKKASLPSKEMSDKH